MPALTRITSDASFAEAIVGDDTSTRVRSARQGRVEDVHDGGDSVDDEREPSNDASPLPDRGSARKPCFRSTTTTPLL